MFRHCLPALVIVSLFAAAPLASASFDDAQDALSGSRRAQSARAAAKASPAATGVVNINTASATDLETLPGIGAKTAERIVEYRQKNGPFKKIEELMNVRGVGEKSFLKLKPQITVGAKAEAATAAVK